MVVVYGRRLISPCQDLAWLSTLEQLETLNIRNLPEKPEDTDPDCFTYLHESIAIRTARMMCTYGHRSLKVIGTGAVTYKDIWIGRSQRVTKTVDFYLCPRIFHVAYPVNITGSRHPVLTQIAQGTAIDAQEYSSNIRIFEPYWLG